MVVSFRSAGQKLPLRLEVVTSIARTPVPGLTRTLMFSLAVILNRCHLPSGLNVTFDGSGDRDAVGVSAVGVAVGVDVRVTVGVRVDVDVGVGVGVWVEVAVGVGVPVRVGVGVGVGTSPNTNDTFRVSPRGNGFDEVSNSNSWSLLLLDSHWESE